ncbi:hypothetical protein [Streptomyces mirabilis]|uniref:hypothetical protein n=1 Tax=Streptomyces mirabilis TaxID=68239 RepID=UPI0036AF8BB9
MPLPDRPMPDSVALRVGRQLPKPVLAALEQQETSHRNVHTLSRLLMTGEMPADARRAVQERVAVDLGRHAAANKMLAAYNPGLIVRIGGAR